MSLAPKAVRRHPFAGHLRPALTLTEMMVAGDVARGRMTRVPRRARRRADGGDRAHLGVAAAGAVLLHLHLIRIELPESRHDQRRHYRTVIMFD